MERKDLATKEYLLPYADQSSSERTSFEDDSEIPESRQSSRKSWWRRISPWYLHIALATAYTATFVFVLRHAVTYNSVFGLVDCAFLFSQIPNIPELDS